MKDVTKHPCGALSCITSREAALRAWRNFAASQCPEPVAVLTLADGWALLTVGGPWQYAG